MTTRILTGTAGWSYPHWNGVVYPRPRPRGFHELEFLSQSFDTVEVNSTFYRPVRPEVARLWLQKVSQNRGFVFTAKLGRRFTHERVLDSREVEEFKAGLKPLLDAGKLGCVLMQFPWSFRFTRENREFLIALRRAFAPFPLAAEMRHSSWMLEEALGTLIDYHISFTNIDQPQLEKAMPPAAHLTAPVAYVRLHGRHRHNWFQDFDGEALVRKTSDYLYSPAELREWQARIRGLAEHASQVFVIFNNDGGGKAVVNALQMQSLLQASAHVRPHRRRSQAELFPERAVA